MLQSSAISNFLNDGITEAVIKAVGKESMTLDNLDALNSTGHLTREAIATAFGIELTPDVIIDFITPNRRMLDQRELQTAVTTVEISYTLTESQYLNSNSFDDPQFVSDLASLLNVDANDIDVTVSSASELTITVELYAAPTSNSEPLGGDTIEDIQNIQSSLSSITREVADTLNVPSSSINSPTLDLCSFITCNATNTDVNLNGSNADSPRTDSQGCIIDTGTCLCKDGFWGIDCSSACVCNANSVDNVVPQCIGSKCKCLWPDYGQNCQYSRICTNQC